MIGKGAAEGTAPQTLARFDHLAIVPAAATGYIQSIDDDGLLALASKADVMLRLRYRPGDFVMSGRGVVEVAPSDHWSKERSGELQECFTVGSKRTPEHDLMFLVSELVEIAARALSPGVNDPMTAVTCLDWLGAGGTEFATREMPKAVRHDAEGKARLIAQPDSFAYFVDQGFGRLRKLCRGRRDRRPALAPRSRGAGCDLPHVCPDQPSSTRSRTVPGTGRGLSRGSGCAPSGSAGGSAVGPPCGRD